MIINSSVAMLRYNLNSLGMMYHFRYKKLTANSLPISKLLAITITGKKLPTNNKPMPRTEKNAAVPAINTDTANSSEGNILFIVVLYVVTSAFHVLFSHVKRL